MPIHIAITRRVRPGCEAEFQAALHEFFQTSFAHGGVLGASMLTPPPGSNSREFGILRTFADEKERDNFHAPHQPNVQNCLPTHLPPIWARVVPGLWSGATH